MISLQSLEFMIIIPICFGIIFLQLPFLIHSSSSSSSSMVSSSPSPSLSSSSSHTKNKKIVSKNMVSVIKFWSTILLILFFILTCCESRMTPLISFIILFLIVSGYSIENETAQLIFHIVSTCSWIGCFDLYFRSSLDTQFYNFFDMKWLVAVYLTTSIVMRAHLGQVWHLHSIPHMFVGIPILCLYYWGLEMPVCGLTDTSFFSCELMRSPPSFFVNTQLNDYYRIFGVLSIVLVHIIYGQLMRSFLPDDIVSNPSEITNEVTSSTQQHIQDYGRNRRSISGVESQRELSNADQSVSTVIIPTSPQKVKDSFPTPKSDEGGTANSSSEHANFASCDLTNYTSDILLRLPSILENSISASFWSSLAAFQPNLLHSNLQHPSPLKSERSLKDCHSTQHKSKCSHPLHTQLYTSPQRILRNPCSIHTATLIGPDDVHLHHSSDKMKLGDSYRPLCSRSVLESSSIPHSELSPPSVSSSGPSLCSGGISEEEAFDIVQKRLQSCKTKRAL